MAQKNKSTFGNKKKDQKLKIISSSSDYSSLEDTTDDLTIRCKFNFSYFDINQGTNFFELEGHQKELIDSFRHYSRKSLSYWKNEGKFVIYDSFPPKEKTKFKKPKYIPNNVCWCRFRLTGKFRLIGFTVPEQLHNTSHNGTGEYFDKNTFYVVFLDPKHEFWIVSKK
jgi:hypothetical protein